MEEIWKDIEGYEGIYQVSSFGRVRALDMFCTDNNGRRLFRKGALLKPRVHKNLHLWLYLSKDGKRKPFYIHRLVASAFVPNKENLPFVNHKNEIPYDNRAENLEWCSKQYNNCYGTARSRDRLTSCFIIEKCSLSGEHLGIFYGERQAAADVGGYPCGIRGAIRNNKPYHGFIYKILEEQK